MTLATALHDLTAGIILGAAVGYFILVIRRSK